MGKSQVIDVSDGDMGAVIQTMEIGSGNDLLQTDVHWGLDWDRSRSWGS